ncbi:cytochrome c family protein [Planctomycetota bacterium]|nr:cytochrome c family protein [Planctomycetota bacterium]
MLPLPEGWNNPEQVIFPPWFDKAVKFAGGGAAFAGIYVAMLVGFGSSDKTLAVGYAPEQPVPYSHALHAGELGIDCRYCHTSVEQGRFANIPPTQTCMNCHSRIRTTSPKLAPVRESYETGAPIEWIRVHDLADFSYFNHSAHVTRGVSCVECHGRVDTMEVVYQAESLSMSWCLDCHRNPATHLRDPEVDRITDLTWSPPAGENGEPALSRAEYGQQVIEKYDLNPPTDCSTCHR